MQKPKLKIILAGVINLFSIAIVAIVLLTPFGKQIAPASAVAPANYQSRWKVIETHYLEIWTHNQKDPIPGRFEPKGKVAIGPSKYEVNYCIGGTGTFDECTGGSKSREIWTVSAWQDSKDWQVASQTGMGGYNTQGAEIEIKAGNTSEDIPSGPLMFVSEYSDCRQEGVIVRSGSYGISYVGTYPGGGCNITASEWKNYWSYSEIPLEWKVETEN